MAKTLDLTFADFLNWMLPQFAQKYNPRGTTFVHPDMYNQFGDKMLCEYDYTAQREQFLIEKAAFYMKNVLNRSQSHNISTNFLEKLANKIAGHYSYYIMNKYPMPETGKSKNKLRIRVQEEIRKVLFDENEYIASLKKKQTENHAFRQKSKSERKKILRGKQYVEVLAARRSAQQIQDMFRDAQNTPRKVH